MVKFVKYFNTLLYISAAENIQNEAIIQPQVIGSNTLANISRRKLDRIWLTIIEEIGTFWRDLGRHLKVRENVIQRIDKQPKPLMAKAKLLMAHYQERADPEKWFFPLCDALEKSRRRDLSEKIQEIMSMNI